LTPTLGVVEDHTGIVGITRAPALRAETRNGMALYVCFGTSHDFKSWLICKITDSKVSHSWIEYPSHVWGGQWVAHSTSRGVIKEIQESVRERYPVHEIYECKADLKKGLDSVRKYVGTADYDFGVLWNGVLLLVYKLIKWKWLYHLVIRNTAKLTCSEFVALILKNAELPGTEEIDPELTTTGQLKAIVTASDDFQRVS
jgi:hypothetical protein